MTKIVHVFSPDGGGEHAFCGLAFDAFASDDHDSDGDFETSRPGLHVTCPECCAAIRAIREAMKGLRLIAASHQGGRL